MAEQKDAPGALELVQQFVNSVDLLRDGRYNPKDELTSPEALRDWLAGRDLMSADEPVSEADLRRAIDVREGLRALLLANNGAKLDEAAVKRLDRAASRASMRARFSPDRPPVLAPDAGGVDGAIAKLMAIVAASVSEGTWKRLKACPRELCYWAFYDNTKNRSGRWCTMSVCGNVEKARAYRERHGSA